MANIDKRHIIDITHLSGENYLSSLIQEACDTVFFSETDFEKLQIQCIEFLAYKCEIYNSGDSSSIRIEAAQNIMKSNLYTIGIYLKSLLDADRAAQALKTEITSELYQKGRKIIEIKVRAAKHIYKLTEKNKLETLNYTYNKTMDDSGIGIFFKEYNPEFAAHEIPSSIDYQLCNTIEDLVGVEYIQKYLESIFCENEFCGYFDSTNINQLLFGYDEGYQDLLINIFEQVLTSALGCIILGKDPLSLSITKDDLGTLKSLIGNMNNNQIASEVYTAKDKLLKRLNVKSLSLINYMEKSLPKVIVIIYNSIITDTLHIVFPPLKNPDLQTKIKFVPDVKMDNEQYRKAIEKLLYCRSSTDKVLLVKDKIHTFGDFEDMLLDAEFNCNEIELMLNLLGDVELAALMKHYPIKTDIMAEELSENELKLCSCLQNYVKQLSDGRQKQIFEMMSCLI